MGGDTITERGSITTRGVSMFSYLLKGYLTVARYDGIETKHSSRLLQSPCLFQK